MSFPFSTLFLLASIFAAACSNSKRQEDCFQDRDFNSLAPGMTRDQVERTLGPLPLSDSIVYNLDGCSGERYVVSFIPTKEVPAPPETDQLILIAIVKFKSAESLQKGEGYYVFPPAVRGRKFGGFDITDRE